MIQHAVPRRKNLLLNWTLELSMGNSRHEIDGIARMGLRFLGPAGLLSSAWGLHRIRDTGIQGLNNKNPSCLLLKNRGKEKQILMSYQ